MPRDSAALARDLGSGYCLPIDGARIAADLCAVADALEKHDLRAARAALAGLRLPAFPRRRNGRLDPSAQERLARHLRAVALLAGERGNGWSLLRVFDPAEARVPADHGRTSGEWTTGGTPPASSPTAAAGVELVGYTPVHALPKDAVAVTPSDGSPIADPSSPTGKLMAPPRANFHTVYAAGQAIAPLPLWDQWSPIRAALAHEGTYDFQRNKAHQKEYLAYVDASNYAVGVYMAGAKHSLSTTLAIAESYALRHSKNFGARGQIKWIIRGWNDAVAGRWK